MSTATHNKNNKITKKYLMYNWEESREVFVGEFSSDDAFWEYYMTNSASFMPKTKDIWHMASF